MPWWPATRYPFDILLTNASYSLQTNNSRDVYVFRLKNTAAFHERFDTLESSFEDSSKSIEVLFFGISIFSIQYRNKTSQFYILHVYSILYLLEVIATNVICILY